MNATLPDQSQSSARREFALQVVQRLREAGYEALWAGGCVRDLLLDRQPVDYDVATSARPEQVRQLFGRDRTLAVGAAFGVIIVRGFGEAAGQVEVATFRNDAGYSDGRRPDSVTFSTAREDAARRDFTINGMFYDPIAGQLIDYVGGQDDLNRSLIRAIGDAEARIAEDKLRMLRAVRFAARFGFAIESVTEAAIARHWSELRIVSGERMTAEMHKTLSESGREYAVSTWARTRLMEVLLPQVAQSWPMVGERASDLMRNIAAREWTACMAALLWPSYQTSDRPAEWLATQYLDLKSRLKFSNDELTQLKFALETQASLSQAHGLRWSQLQPLLIHPSISVAVDLLRARLAVGEIDLPPLAVVEERLGWSASQLDPPPLIDGRDLSELGLEPGPRFKSLLQSARDAQLDGQLQSAQQALAWIRTLPEFG